MRITIISGSHRNPSQSIKVARHIQTVLLAKDGVDSVEIFSLADNPLPLWDQRVWEGDPEWQELLGPLQTGLRESDGFVIVSPEWHGQVPSGLKNFFLLCSAREVGHKPALIVTVSAGDGGAYPVAELRMSSYKNNRICYIPEQIIVRKVEQVLNEDVQLNDAGSDDFYRRRISWSLDILKAYATALKPLRESGITDTELFKNGM
ncbi:MAG: NAD(P)H-dependent oxidoreductase [Gammaproteobacteria bacterium]|nr:NAD(P)H-dependent oxidoreductase [Gammaproteobacteria bacterium]MCB1863519.1 NAD(P)H-dependent oxidoreductase [Gammaproteobacteria bacterium]MCP5444167.1 NAD(P)H-dependent oxidoreductase [Chromatiaceae bacterium]